MKNRPVYGIDSVDHALHLAAILQQEGPLRVTDAAQRLGVSRSTAHRLLAMLVYRDFAEQGDDRRYRAGPVLSGPTAQEPVGDLHDAGVPHLRALSARTGETANLVRVVGDEARFVASAECDQVLRVGDRAGRALPAHLTSAGRAVLAGMGEERVRELYSGPGSPADPDAVLRDLRAVRWRGYAVNDQDTEAGVVAVGCALPGGDVPAGVSLAMPSVRYRRENLPAIVRDVGAAAERIGRDVAWAAGRPWHAG